MSAQAVNISQLQEFVENTLNFSFSSKRFLGPAHSKTWGQPVEFGPEMSQTALEWIMDGSECEDESVSYFVLPYYSANHDMRSVNHYYNPFWDNRDLYPYTDDGWGESWESQEGGLNDALATGIGGWDLWVGKPSKRWGYDGCPGSPPVSDFTRSPDNYFSWVYARKYFYAALSGDSIELDGIGGIEGKANMNENERNRCFALLFRSLGQLMHLIQDAGNPEHTRNDAHPLSGFPLGFESYAATQDLSSAFWASPAIPWRMIVKSDNPFFDFFDSNRSGGGYSPSESSGLAEFSNHNFFTKDSIIDNLMHDYCEPDCVPYGHERYRFFTHPRVNEALSTLEDGRLFKKTYYWSEPIVDPLGIAPTQSVRLATKGWYSDLLIRWGSKDYTTTDEKIQSDYLDILVRKCIGYSAAFLDYFFRGRIEITLAETGVYAITQDPDPSPGNGFSRISLLARNITDDGEEMSDGSIELVVKYKLALADPFRNYEDLVPVSSEFLYIVAPEAKGAREIPRKEAIKLEFDLEDNPIPLWATDVYLQVVYRGQLGLEDGAVAAGFKDISEPTPMDIINNMDKICIHGEWMDAGSAEAVAAVDKNQDGIADPDEWDVYPHDLKNIYLAFSPVSDCRYPSCTDEDLKIAYLGAGEYVRFFLLTDERYCMSHCAVSVVHTHPDDRFGFTFLGPKAWSFIGLKHQTETETDPEVCGLYGLDAPCELRHYPYFISLKRIERWNRHVFHNAPYPPGSSCSYKQLP